jgi:predicted DNA-binding protein (MmcQ/YjbR family)
VKPEEAFSTIRRHCLAKAGAVEEYPWGETVWKVGGKLFAFTSSARYRFTVKASKDDQAILIQQPSVSVANHVGRFGWVTVEVVDEESLGLAPSLVDDSYAAVIRRKRPFG